MSPDTKDYITFGLPVLGFLWNGFTWLAMRRIEAQKASETRMKQLEETSIKLHAENAIRLVRLETAAKAVPTKEELTRIHSRMDEVERVLHELVGKSEAANHTLQLINQYLLNGGSK